MSQSADPRPDASADMDSVQCGLTLTIGSPAEIVLQVAAAHGPGRVVLDRIEALTDGHAVLARQIVDTEDNRGHVLRTEPGTLSVCYSASIARSYRPEPQRLTDVQRIVALRPSRYSPSDRMAGFAQRLFGSLPSAEAKVRAIGDYVWQNLTYDPAATGPGYDAAETLLTGRGVCRDFAHLVVTLCRAVGVPARMAAVYAPGLSPMDFHAVAETAIDDHWWCWDATRLAPRQTLVRIATGRDAADVAFETTLFGEVELSNVEIVAIAAGQLPTDDHEQLVALG